MRSTVLLLSSTLLMACSASGIQDAEETVRITVTQSTYAPGDELTVKLENVSSRLIHRNTCQLELQRRTEDGNWVRVAGRTCAPPADNALSAMQPSSIVEDAFQTAASVPLGEYRFRFDLRYSGGRLLPERERVSDVFTIGPRTQ